jgi:hypothetical protein
MGFDLHSRNPQINKDFPPEYNKIMEEYGEGNWLDWKKTIPEKVKDRYFEIKNQYEKDNPGYYFRNNVWWWRPLWSFVCRYCDDILSEETMSGGNSNDGVVIYKYQAVAVAKKLQNMIDEGYVKKYEKEYKQELDNLPLEDCTYCNQTGFREWKQEDGSIKIKNCNVCNTEHKDKNVPVGKVKSFTCSYPFSEKNVIEFANFCRESGGFEIW